MCQSMFFLNKVAGVAYNFIKQETLGQVFLSVLQNLQKDTSFTEHLR